MTRGEVWRKLVASRYGLTLPWDMKKKKKKKKKKKNGCIVIDRLIGSCFIVILVMSAC